MKEVLKCILFTLFVFLGVNVDCQSRLNIKIEFSKDSIMIGEEVYWNIIVENLKLRKVSIFYDAKGNYHNELYRDSDLTIVLMNSQNELIDQLSSEEHMIRMVSKRVGYKELSKNENLKYQQWLSDWYRVSEPGMYKIRIEKMLTYKSFFGKSYNVLVGAEKEIYFYASNKDEYNKHLEELENDYRDSKFEGYTERDNLLETIFRSSSETNLDFFNELINSKNSSNANRAIRALGKLNDSEDAFLILIDHFENNFTNSIRDNIKRRLYSSILESLQINALNQMSKFSKEIALVSLYNIVNNQEYSDSVNNKFSDVIESIEEKLF